MYFLLYTLVLTIVVSLFIKKGQQDVQGDFLRHDSILSKIYSLVLIIVVTDTAMNTKAQQDIEGGLRTDYAVVVMFVAFSNFCVKSQRVNE